MHDNLLSKRFMNREQPICFYLKKEREFTNAKTALIYKVVRRGGNIML